jgi:hypothetical protein
LGNPISQGIQKIEQSATMRAFGKDLFRMERASQAKISRYGAFRTNCWMLGH